MFQPWHWLPWFLFPLLFGNHDSGPQVIRRQKIVDRLHAGPEKRPAFETLGATRFVAAEPRATHDGGNLRAARQALYGDAWHNGWVDDLMQSGGDAGHINMPRAELLDQNGAVLELDVQLPRARTRLIPISIIPPDPSPWVDMRSGPKRCDWQAFERAPNKYFAGVSCARSSCEFSQFFSSGAESASRSGS